MLRRRWQSVWGWSWALGLLLGLMPTLQALGGATYTHLGVQYGFDHFRQSMELYLPVETCGPTPVAVYIHGGGWLTGQATNVMQYLDELIARGFAVASLSYRFSQDGIHPAQIHDCKGAIRWLRANALAHNLDADRIGVFGDSAGGHLAALLGTSGGDPFLEGTVGDNDQFSSAVQAVFDINGPTDLMALGAGGYLLGEISQLIGHSITDIVKHQAEPEYADLVAFVQTANPASYVDAADPPFQLLHGDADTVVPSSQSQILHDALIGVMVASTFELLPGVGHGIPNIHYETGFDFLAATLLAEPPQPIDITCDGLIGVDDLLAIINQWGNCPVGQQPCPADVNGDDVVNVDDLLLVINNWD